MSRRARKKSDTQRLTTGIGHVLTETESGVVARMDRHPAEDAFAVTVMASPNLTVAEIAAELRRLAQSLEQQALGLR